MTVCYSTLIMELLSSPYPIVNVKLAELKRTGQFVLTFDYHALRLDVGVDEVDKILSAFEGLKRVGAIKSDNHKLGDWLAVAVEQLKALDRADARLREHLISMYFSDIAGHA